MLEGSKIKSDLSSVMKQLPTFVLKDSIERFTEDVKRIRVEIADNGYEV